MDMGAEVDTQCSSVDRNPRRAAIVTKSGSDPAFILRITRPLCACSVMSLMPSSQPNCLFNRPEMTNTMTANPRRTLRLQTATDKAEIMKSRSGHALSWPDLVTICRGCTTEDTEAPCVPNDY